MATFELTIDNLLKKEGGKVDHKSDPGGATNKGITLAIWLAYGRDIDGDGDIDKTDLWLIKNDDAAPIYRQRFWEKMNLDSIANQPLAEIIMDHGVNAGTGRAIKMAQYVLNKHFGQILKLDGDNGPKTAAAINAADPEKLFNLYKKLRLEYYTYRAALLPDTYACIPFFKVHLKLGPSLSARDFIKGWLNRVNSFKYR